VNHKLVRKISLCLFFFTLAPLILALSLLSLRGGKKQFGVIAPSLYAAVPESAGQVSGVFATDDARPVMVRKYLEKYNSPLLPYAKLILSLSEKYQVDFRLPLAIAQCESNVCKKIPEDSFNCWGFENGATKFNSWEHALERVFATLKTGYIDKGLVTPEQIMPKYAPPSVEKGGPWAKCVSQFLKEME